LALMLIKEYNHPVNIPNNRGLTPLHCAVQLCGFGHVATSIMRSPSSVTRFLGAPTAGDAAGNKPVDRAVFINLAEDLLKAGADVNMREDVGKGLTALHVAAAQGNIAICRVLVDFKANLECKNKKGQKASEVAKGQKHYSCAEYLGSCEKDAKENERPSHLEDAAGWNEFVGDA